jgi:hypothetical protein
MTKLPEGWSWYNVIENFTLPEIKDVYEANGLKRNYFSWNIALDEKLSCEDIMVEELEESGYVWSEPIIKLHTHCYKAPYLCAPYEKKTFEPCGEYQYVTEKLDLELVPYGCTNLRITYFPKAKI